MITPQIPCVGRRMISEIIKIIVGRIFAAYRLFVALIETR
jgi:hypothetical protein